MRKAQDEAFERQRREQVELAEDAALQRLREARERALEQKAGQMEQLAQLKASILADRAANKEAVRASALLCFLFTRRVCVAMDVALVVVLFPICMAACDLLLCTLVA